jgi:putative flippase GtrA
MAAGKFGHSDSDVDRTRGPIEADIIRQLAQRLPRPLRFLAVGGLGITTDIGFFTLAATHGAHPFAARALSLGVATLVTWRLNRHLTFERSGRKQRLEAMRYLAVTLTAQATSYAVFALLIVTIMAPLPQLAIIIGAAIAALVSYNGHRLIAFAPRKPSARGSLSEKRQWELWS